MGGGVLTGLIGREYGAAEATVDDDLPQVLADTVTDLLGRPRMRGWIHLCSAAVFIVAGAALVPVAWFAASPEAGWATLLYSTTVVAMFSVSAVYHRVRWHSPTTQQWMKRADHSLIFVFIAGCYTPVALLTMPASTARLVLAIVYVGAAAGVGLKMLWPSAPRSVTMPVFLLLGYVALFFSGAILHGGGPAVFALLFAGALLYNIGAILYWLSWPNPWPRTFGYHEFFHAFTVAAALCHYVAIWLIVL